MDNNKPSLDKLLEEVRWLHKESVRISQIADALFDDDFVRQAGAEPDIANLNDLIDSAWLEASLRGRQGQRKKSPSDMSDPNSDVKRAAEIMFRAMQAGHRAALSPQSAPEKPRGLDAMKNAEDLLAETRKSIDEMAASARREAEERRRLVLAAEEALRTAQEGISCLDGNPEVPAALLHTLSAFFDLSELFLSSMKGFR